ncbi:MAG: hypothetical protein R6V54_09705, partial [Desulfobacteraceae bacterium]
CCCLAGFAISRSGGHILKQFLFMAGHEGLWSDIGAVAGSINTFLLIIVAAVTLFFNRVRHVYIEICPIGATQETGKKTSKMRGLFFGRSLSS